MSIKKIIGIIAIGSISLIGCNNKDEKTGEDVVMTPDSIKANPDTPMTTPVATMPAQPEDEGISAMIAETEVPETVKMAFVKKNPKVKPTEWRTYKPVESDDLPMDDQYYNIIYTNEGADYMSWYNNRGDLVRTSSKVPGNSKLPDPVNQYINKNYPDYTIEDISKENDKNTDMFKIKLKKGGDKVKLKILPNGEVFKKK